MSNWQPGVKENFDHMAQERQQQKIAAQQQAEAQKAAEAEKIMQTIQPIFEELKGDTKNMNEQTIKEIMNRHAEAARLELEREAAKSETQQALEAAQRKQDALAQEYAVLAKNANANLPRLKVLGAELKTVDEEISTHTSVIEYQRAQEEAAKQPPQVQRASTPKPLAAMPNMPRR
jgi:hypothetical protein